MNLPRLLLALALVGPVALVSTRAAATTVAPLTVDQMTDAADLVVRGVVLETWTDLDEQGAVYTYARIRVTASLKGYADPADELVVETPGGVYDGVVAPVHAAARYSVDEEAVLFLAEKRFGTSYGTVAMARGKYTVKMNPADGQPMVVSFTRPWNESFDARFVPTPPAADRLSLAAFEAQVLARVERGWDGRPIPGISATKLRSINKLQPGVR